MAPMLTSCRKFSGDESFLATSSTGLDAGSGLGAVIEGKKSSITPTSSPKSNKSSTPLSSPKSNKSGFAPKSPSRL